MRITGTKQGRILIDNLSKAYGVEAAEEVVASLEEELFQVEVIKDADKDHGAVDWHHKFNLYVTYPDSIEKEGSVGLQVLAGHLGKLREMGFNAVHVLPIFKSPLIDYGFDVADFYKVRDSIGGDEAMDDFLREARGLDLRVFIDLTLHHVSEQHQWFQKALAGEEHYQNFFYHRYDPPKLLEKGPKGNSYKVRYLYEDHEVENVVFFPEQCGEIPNWVQHDSLWYYHTFYPQQIDLNYDNPAVFLEIAKVVIFWANRGVNFRLDAAAFVGKNFATGEMENTAKCHQILRALHAVLKLANSESIFLVEAFTNSTAAIDYYGSKDEIEAELNYDFTGMGILWDSMLQHNSRSLTDYITEQVSPPDWANLITFMRNHDELTLEFTSADVRERLLDKLLARGLEFRGGFGIAGRTASFLRNIPERVVLMHLLLASMPGNPAVIYGDELGKGNDHSFMEEMMAAKQVECRGGGLVEDARDINRGRLELESYDDPAKASISNQISKILQIRNNLFAFKSAYLEKIPGLSAQLFAVIYHNSIDPQQKIAIIINLGEMPITLGDQALPKLGETLLNINQVEIDHDATSITFPAYSGIWARAVG